MVTEITREQLARFKRTVRRYYEKNRRDLPWRRTFDPYAILVSEIMLQQTQVDRVVPKYKSFLNRFPTFASLAKAKNYDVLNLWQGLGYNRRALFLKRTAEEVMQQYRGVLPSDPETLRLLPGIGPYTSVAVGVFAFGMPLVCIETNIRSVFIHYFFSGKERVSDTDILPLIERTLDRKNPREWYYALMDYGSILKRNGNNPSRRSMHHVRQNTFRGSDRELRGKILRLLLEGNSFTPSMIALSLDEKIERIEKVLGSLGRDGFTTEERGTFWLRAT